MRATIDPVTRSTLLVLVAVSLAACYGDPDPPPRPTETRVATSVGQIVERLPDDGRYVLTDGTVVDIGTPESSGPRATKLTETDVWSPSVDAPGGLLLYGTDDAGAFYGATMPPDDAGCFGVRGVGYVEDDRLHLSSGLVLLFAAGVEVRNDRAQFDPAWLLDFDRVCLDATGAVTSVHQLPLGA